MSNDKNKKHTLVNEPPISKRIGLGLNYVAMQRSLAVVPVEIDYDVIYAEFCVWYSRPDIDRWEMLGVSEADIQNPKHYAYRRAPTQRDFAKFHGIHENTCSRWKREPTFGNQVSNEREAWGKNLTANVIASLYRRCIKYGMAYDVETWLAYIEGWDRKQVIQVVERYDTGDIRAILSALPPEEQQEFYEYITRAIQRAELHRRRGENQALAGNRQ